MYDKCPADFTQKLIFRLKHNEIKTIQYINETQSTLICLYYSYSFDYTFQLIQNLKSDSIYLCYAVYFINSSLHIY